MRRLLLLTLCALCSAIQLPGLDSLSALAALVTALLTRNTVTRALIWPSRQGLSAVTWAWHALTGPWRGEAVERPLPRELERLKRRSRLGPNFGFHTRLCRYRKQHFRQCSLVKLGSEKRDGIQSFEGTTVLSHA